MAEIRVAVIGVGNVGSTFVQGIDCYSGRNTVGLWHRKVAGMTPANIRVASAFDISPAKVGKSLLEVANQISSGYHATKDPRITISPGLLAGDSCSVERPVTSTSADVVKELIASGTQVALNLISSGMDKTSLEYARAALKAGAAFVNATPAQVAKNATIAGRFARRRLVLAGDDLLSQFGGTAFHKGMIDFMVERGVHVKKSYQLDVGGSAETKKTMDERIRMTKRAMKTSSINMEAPYKFKSVAGTTEYTDFLGDLRNSYYWMSSEGFLGTAIVMDLMLRTRDGANAGNVLMDVARAIGGAKGVKTVDAARVISAYGFKSPPRASKIREAYASFLKLFC
jgi:myo-inositol-1-phosphate synthase